MEGGVSKIARVDYSENGDIVFSEAGKKNYLKCELVSKVLKCNKNYEEDVLIPYEHYLLEVINEESYEFIVNSLSKNSILIRKLGYSQPKTITTITI